MKPSPPVGPMVFSDIQSTSVTVAWKPSENDGGAPIKEYILEAKEVRRATWSKVTKVRPDITSYCAQDLKEKQEYVFRVFAENEIGRSEPLVSDSVLLKSPYGKFQKHIQNMKAIVKLVTLYIFFYLKYSYIDFFFIYHMTVLLFMASLHIIKIV